MQKTSSFEYVDGLIQGIRSILSGNRCSFSEEEKLLLSNAIRYLENSKRIGNKKPIDWSLVFKGIEILNRVFFNSDDFPNFF